MNTDAMPAILGGTPVRSQPFPDRRTIGKEETEAVLRVLESDCLSAFIGGAGEYFNGGREVRAFEQQWAEREGFKHAISVNSWTSGLIIACGSVGIQPGDEVIVPPYTMSASATAPMFYGGIPVFADVDPTTFCLDPDSVASCITERTKAIMVVHLFGRCAPMDEILALARQHDIKVIEDAAQAPGVYDGDRAVGAIGDVGGFSLNYHKHIHTGEGGMLVTNDDAIAEKCRLIRNHGENVHDEKEVDDPVNIIGGNYRLTELQAAIGIEQLKRLDDILDTRNELAHHFASRLNRVPGLSATIPQGRRSHAYYIFPFLYDADQVGLSRDQFVQAVHAELPQATDFESTPLEQGYVRPLYLSRIYQDKCGFGPQGQPWAYQPDVDYCYEKGICPVTEDLHERKMLLSPLIREPLSTSDIDDLADAIDRVASHAPEIRDALENSAKPASM
ncbi:MAG: DegT/DnrJ/EryC1/StrS family aminotransferase [Phycisphaerales bacterium]|nr:DegT/DnrJ/EryC1/StrS family aminotransferase [Phycisphaerales bacterium]MCH2153680.1 DegT/DnrJ/EryC1/StrS family aminotransferase [Phycisphaerales bacterium]